MELKELENKMKIKPETETRRIVNFIQDFLKKLKRERIVIGLSGGLDSSVILELCIRAIENKKITALIMPDKDTSRKHLRDAVLSAKKSGVNYKIINITRHQKVFGTYYLSFYNKFFIPRILSEKLSKKAYSYYAEKTESSPFSESIVCSKPSEKIFFSKYVKEINAYYRIKHRIRMLLMYKYAELNNALVVGAANKTEFLTGFFVKHGCDSSTDIMPIMHLYKTQVRILAEYLGVEKRIINKAPSPDIIPGIDDEFALGIDYKTLDLCLLGLELKIGNDELSRILKISLEKIERIKLLVKNSEHMRNVYSLLKKTCF
ncbi:MAG: NAD(+) synthase [Candidatus Woesearchaeota archaeon]